MSTERTLVYVNQFISTYVSNPVVKDYLKDYIGTNWKSFADIMLPMELLENHKNLMTDEFFHGVAASQYADVQRGGIFINPFLSGLSADFEMWNNFLHKDPEFLQNIVYIDIPYEIYLEVVDENDMMFVDENDYAQGSNAVRSMVGAMRSTYYSKDEAIH